MYFKDAIVRSIVLSTEHSLGIITSNQESHKHGAVVTVLFGRPQQSSFQRNYDVQGRELVGGIPVSQLQTLFFADDREFINVTATLNAAQPRPVPRWSDALNIGQRLYDVCEGWGRVVEKDDRTGIFTVEFTERRRTIPKRLSYRHSGHVFGSGNKFKPKRIFAEHEIRSGAMAVQITTDFKGEDAPGFTQSDPFIIKYGRRDEEDKPKTKKSYVFFYKPAGAVGFLQNIMIGTGTGETLDEAIDELYNSVPWNDSTRGEVFDTMVRKGNFAHLFAYEFTHLPDEMKNRFKAMDVKLKATAMRKTSGPLLAKAASLTRSL